MAEKEQQSQNPLAPGATLGNPRSDDAESAASAGELRKKKRNKLILFIVLFAIFQTGIILIFSLTVMKVRTPGFRLRSAALTNTAVGAPANPSFSATVSAELAVKNSNFGRYKYRSTAVEFQYRGARAGRVVAGGASAGWRSTRRFEVVMDLNLAASSQLASDLSAGVLPLTSRAEMRGTVELVFVMRKSRSTAFNCSMDFVLATQLITNIVCN